MRLSLLGSRVTHLEAPVHTHSRWPLDLGRAWIVARRIVGEEQNPPEHRLGLTNWVTASAEWPLVYTTWAATPAGVCWLRYASVTVHVRCSCWSSTHHCCSSPSSTSSPTERNFQAQQLHDIRKQKHDVVKARTPGTPVRADSRTLHLFCCNLTYVF